MKPPASVEAKVRMYRQGLGDCFLLTFTSEPDDAQLRRTTRVLIDCGVILGTPDSQTIMRRVAEDILQETGGYLDLLVATHEHWDHLSGFLQAKEVFDRLSIGTVWLAWTEDEANETARRIRAERTQTLAALRALVADAQSRPSLTAMGLDQVLNFFGDPQDTGGGQGTGGQDTVAALKALKARKKSTISYRTPGEAPLSLPGQPEALPGQVPPVRVYVLGPPLDERLLKKSNPSSRASEVYGGLNMAPVGLDAAFLAASNQHLRVAAPVAAEPDEWEELLERCLPFDRRHQMAPGDEQKSYPSYFLEPEKYRRIDTDWLQTAGELGLKLDSDTNNTSLALAFELTANGAVLLFPGDAQVGNWLSWDALSWVVPDPASPPGALPKVVTAADLLQRTVLYKVGHHASHNATLREKGLERMVSGSLLALVPVSLSMATKKRWQMPFPPLLDRLKEKTNGRVLVSDRDITGQATAIDNANVLPVGVSVNPDENPLYFEVTIRG